MHAPGDIPVLSTQQMVEVDRLMMEEYQISLLQMMENAGRSLAELVRRILGGNAAGRSITILCGAGNNGGGGMVAARHLHNWGAAISPVLAFEADHLKEVPAHQLRILKKMGLALHKRPELENADLIIDALIGYGIKGDPRQLVAEWIDRANRAGRPILALDVPSGLDATSGIPGVPCIKAAATLTLALPKSGLLSPQVVDYVGELYLADISVPPRLYREINIDVPNLFAKDPILRIS